MKILKILKICQRCNGKYNVNSSDSCPTCFGKGEIIEIIPNVIAYEEIQMEKELES